MQRTLKEQVWGSTAVACTATEIILGSLQPSPFTALMSQSDVRKVAFVLFSPSAFFCTAVQLSCLPAWEWEREDPLFSIPASLKSGSNNSHTLFRQTPRDHDMSVGGSTAEGLHNVLGAISKLYDGCSTESKLHNARHQTCYLTNKNISQTISLSVIINVRLLFNIYGRSLLWSPSIPPQESLID